MYSAYIKWLRDTITFEGDLPLSGFDYFIGTILTVFVVLIIVNIVNVVLLGMALFGLVTG